MNHDQQAEPQRAKPREPLTAEQYRAARRTEPPFDCASIDFASRAAD